MTYASPAALPDDLWTAWKFAPSVLILLAATIFLYGWGLRNVWQRAGRGHGITTRQWVSFVGAIFLLVIALMSPLDELSDQLFSAHMVQHLILMLVAAPLLILSDIQLAILWALPRRRAQQVGGTLNQSRPVSGIWRVLNHPVVVWILFTVTLWIWHAPRFYQAALGNQLIHTFEHLTFLLTAMLYWWILVKRNRPDHLHYAMTVPFLFLTVLQSSILGALMTFTSQPWYPNYAVSVMRWGLSPLEDQQIAGLIMWMPGGAIFTLLTIGHFAAWLRALERHSVQLHRRNVHPTHQELP